MIKVKRLLTTLLLLTAASFADTTITGTIKDPSTGNLFNGNMSFVLSFNGARQISTNSALVQPRPAPLIPVNNGSLPVGFHMPGNDDIAPSKTVYMAMWFDVNGQLLRASPFYISGTTFDLGQAVPTAITTSNINFLDMYGLRNVTIQNLGNIIFANQVPTGATVGAKIDAACAVLNGNPGIVVLTYPMGAGWSLTGIPSNCAIFDLRGTGGFGGSAFKSNYNLSCRSVVQYSTTLSIPSCLYVEFNPQAGGYNTGTSKTQYQAIRIFQVANTVGERKGLQADVNCFGTGDCIGVHGIANDWGGYGSTQTGGEGAEGGRFQVCQGDCSTVNDNYYGATVSNVAGNNISLTSTHGGDITHVGADVPWIITNRATYSTGTITSISGSPCTILGSGTTWTSLGTGAHNDLYLSLPANSSGSNKLVWPIKSITDDTHAVMEYHLSEVGDTCPSSTDSVTSGGYTIYKGVRPTDLSASNTNGIPSYVVVPTMTSGTFLVGDTIEQHVGYNFHGVGVQITLGRIFGSNLGGGIRIANAYTKEFSDSIFVNGNFVHGMRFGTGTISGSLFAVSMPVTGAIFDLVNQTAGNQIFLHGLNSVAGSQNLISYDHANNYLGMGNGAGFLNFSTNTNTVGWCSTPQAGVTHYIGCPTGANGFAIFESSSSAGAGVPLVRFSQQGTYAFQIFPNGLTAQFWNGYIVKGYSDAGSTLKWSINSATGAAAFQAFSATSGSFSSLLNTAGIIASGNIQASNSVITGTTSNTDLAGAISLVAAASASYTFANSWASAPRCTASPLADLGGAHWWITISTTTLTVNVSSATTIDFTYICHPRT